MCFNADRVSSDRAAEEEIMNLSRDSSGYWSVSVSPDPMYNIQKVVSGTLF